MKTAASVSIILCFLFPADALRAQQDHSADSATFYYVLENPKYFGSKARGWFEIAGLKDKAVEAKINKTLRKTYLERTKFAITGEHGWNQKKDTITPAGFTDYTYVDNTFAYDMPFLRGWVRFKDSDRYLRLAKHAEGYGMGENLHNFYFSIAPDKMAYLCIQPWDKKYKYEYNAVELTFSLVDGRVMPNEYIVRINPVMKDSLTHALDDDAKANLKAPDGKPLNCKLIPIRPVSDSCIISAEALVCWFIPSDFNPCVFGRVYNTECDPPPQGYLSPLISIGYAIQGMLPFLISEDWEKLQEVYK